MNLLQNLPSLAEVPGLEEVAWRRFSIPRETKNPALWPGYQGVGARQKVEP